MWLRKYADPGILRPRRPGVPQGHPHGAATRWSSGRACSILTAFLAILFLPVLFILLLVTIIGIPVAIFLLPVCVVVLMMFGKASFYALIGRLISGDRLHPSVAVVVGGLICLLFFVIPFAGLVLSLLLSLLMMGCGIVALFSSARRSQAPAAPGGPGAAGARLRAPGSGRAGSRLGRPPPARGRAR